MKIVFITEAGRGIGFGHLSRCVAVAQALRERRFDPLIVLNSDIPAIGLLGGIRHRIFNWLKEKERLFDTVSGSAIAIIDSYVAGINIYRQLACSVRLGVYIDDNARLPYPKGVIVNAGINAKNIKYGQANGVYLLCGPEYAYVRKEFWKASHKPIRKRIRSFLITMGGVDLEGLSGGILRFLVEYYPNTKKVIIIGKGFSDLSAIHKYSDSRTVLCFYPNAAGVRRLMLEADIAISAAGQTLYELARLGVPTTAISVAENQRNNVLGWQKENFIEYSGRSEDDGLYSRLGTCISRLHSFSLRKEKSRIGRKIVDGNGPLRIVRELLKHAENEQKTQDSVYGR